MIWFWIFVEKYIYDWYKGRLFPYRGYRPAPRYVVWDPDSLKLHRHGIIQNFGVAADSITTLVSRGHRRQAALKLFE